MSGKSSKWLIVTVAAVVGGVVCFGAINQGLKETPPAPPKAPIYPAPEVTVTVDPIEATVARQDSGVSEGIIHGSARRSRRHRVNKPKPEETRIEILPGTDSPAPATTAITPDQKDPGSGDPTNG